jgi:hypothetical protein
VQTNVNEYYNEQDGKKEKEMQIVVNKTITHILVFIIELLLKMLLVIVLGNAKIMNKTFRLSENLKLKSRT